VIETGGITNRRILVFNNYVAIKWMLYAASVVYYLFFGSGLFFYQENRSLFIFTYDYLQHFLSKPGGLLVYMGNFLNQGYYYNVIGALLISSFPVILISLLMKNFRLLSKSNSRGMHFSIITACGLFFLQTFYDHFIYHSVGLLLGLLWMYALMSLKKKYQLISFLVLFPAVYYFAGAFSLFYVGLYFSFILAASPKPQRLPGLILLFVNSLAVFIVFKEFVFLQPGDKLLSFPLPALNFSVLSISFYSFCLYLILVPHLPEINSMVVSEKRSIKHVTSVSVICLVTVFFTTLKFDKEQEDIMQIEKMVFQQKWDAVIEHIEKSPSANLIRQYYYNLALSEKGLLCDKLFFGSQDFKEKSLSLPHSSEYINRAYYFYYCIGLSKAANYLAFESMVINGYQPENLKMLVKTEIIRGNLKIAERFVHLLKQTLNYRNWALKYEKIIHDPSTMYSDSELVEKMELTPGNDFFITTDDNYNMNAMLWGNPNNPKAFEYIIARMLLEKDFKAVVYQVKKMKGMGYNDIPRHIEEAILLYMHEGLELPYLGELTVSNETLKDFENFQSAFLSDTNFILSDDDTKNKLKNTFWYYFYKKEIKDLN
jgi:hypothetical protein